MNVFPSWLSSPSDLPVSAFLNARVIDVCLAIIWALEIQIQVPVLAWYVTYPLSCLYWSLLSSAALKGGILHTGSTQGNGEQEAGA